MKLTAQRLGHPAVISSIVNLVVFTATYLAFTPAYQTNDDVGLMSLVAGGLVTVERSPVLVFSHTWIGEALAFLYGISRSVPWYPIYLVGSLLVAHVVLLAVVSARFPRIGLGLYLAYFLLFGWKPLLSLQFTVVAGYVALAGAALAVRHLSVREEAGATDRARLAGSVALFGLASMIRWEAPLMVGLVAAPGLVITAASALRRRSRSWRTIVGLVVSWAAVFGLLRVAQHLSLTAEWREFLSYNLARGRLGDLRPIDHAEPEVQRAALEAAGWSRNDHDMLLQWFFVDEEVYARHRLEAAISQLPVVQTATSFSTALTRAGARLRPRLGLGYLTFVAALMLIYAPLGRQLLGATGTLLTSIAVIVLLLYAGRPPPERLMDCLVAATVWIPWLVASQSTLRPLQDRRWLGGILAAAAILLMVLSVASLTRIRAWANGADKNRAAAQTALERLASEPGWITVSWGAALPLEHLHPLRVLETLDSMRLVQLGALSVTQSARAYVRSMGIEDLYLAIVTDERIRVCVSAPGGQRTAMFQQYMREHYNLETRAELLDELGRFEVYRFHTVK